MSSLAIVIVNWNTRDVLAQCLASVFAEAPARGVAVWVVDNASADGSQAMVRGRFPLVHLIENAANCGFARANNQGIEASSGEYVLLLNSDTIVQAQALERMAAFLDEHARVGLVGPAVCNPDGSAQWSFGAFPTLLTEVAMLCGLDRRSPLARRLQPRLGAGEAARPVDWVLGAAMMLRRAALQQAGLLDGRFFMYSEEVDLAYRIKARGWQVYVVGEALITHFGQQSSRRAPAQMKAQLFLSKELYLRKHGRRGAGALLSAAFAAAMAGKYWAYRLLRKRSESNFWQETWQHYRRLKAGPSKPAPLAPTPAT